MAISPSFGLLFMVPGGSGVRGSNFGVTSIDDMKLGGIFWLAGVAATSCVH